MMMAQLIGDDTSTSIHSGVLKVQWLKWEGITTHYRNLYPALKSSLTRGDHNYFDKRLKNSDLAAQTSFLQA